MVLQPIPPGYGQPGDMYDNRTSPQERDFARSAASESTEASPSSGRYRDNVLQKEAPHGQPSLRPNDGTQSLPAPSPTRIITEDPTNFDASAIAITILLDLPDGHPQGRPVHVSIHNHVDVVAVRTFREAHLTRQDRLDNIQEGIHITMQHFLLELTAHQQKRLEKKAKQLASTDQGAVALQATKTAPAPLVPQSPVVEAQPKASAAPVAEQPKAASLVMSQHEKNGSTSNKRKQYEMF